MIIENVEVKNFRCVMEETLPCNSLTVMVGPNGAGKSTFLRAIDLFYATRTNYSADDFYNGDTSREISIKITFSELTDYELEQFAPYLDGDSLSVEKILLWPPGRGNQAYYGWRLQNPEFDAFQQASGQGFRAEYNKLKDGDYSDFPDYQNKESAEDVLRQWEQDNPDKCTSKRDDGQFFGFREVGSAKLERFTRFILVPAVRDASEDASEGRDTVLSEIMDLVVRNVLAEREDILELRQTTQTRYEELVDPSKLSELQNLESDLDRTLKTFIADASVRVTWLAGDAIQIPMPKADIKLIEDEYLSSVERTGHGLQRTFILTLLQHLAVIQQRPGKQQEPEAEARLEIEPNIIIGIEEPELYQHPNRQRHLSKVLYNLAHGEIPGVTQHTQIIYGTHSPLFVDIQWFDKIRALRKNRLQDDFPKCTQVISTTLDDVAHEIETASEMREGTFTGDTLKPRLRTLMTPWMNEGFFSDVAVLVEGEEDRAAIVAVASFLGHDFEDLGISVIPCSGKNNLDRPTSIFRNLGIPVYVIWDSDQDKGNAVPEENRRLLRLMGEDPEDWPQRIEDTFACFRQTLGHVLREECGEEIYDEVLFAQIDDFGLRKTHAEKNPQVIQAIIQNANDQGNKVQSIEAIVGKIIDLKSEK